MVHALEALVRIESPSDDAEAQARLFTVLESWLTELDYTCTRPPGGSGTLMARPAGSQGQPQQLIVAHTDTVWPHGTLQTRPFRFEGDRAWGPGTYDTKAGIVQAVFALRALAACGQSPALAPVLLLNGDEEVGSPGTRTHVADAAQASQRAFVLEPSLGPEGHLKTARKGVGHFQIAIEGRAAHAGLNPEHGASATTELAHQILALQALNDPTRGISVNVAPIWGGTRRNVVADAAGAQVDVRVRTAADGEAIAAAILALTARTEGCTVVPSGRMVKAPMVRTPDSLALWDHAHRIATSMGWPLDHGAAGGGSDGNTTALHCPTLDGLGAVGAGAHAEHEHVRIPELPKRAALLAALLLA